MRYEKYGIMIGLEGLRPCKIGRYQKTPSTKRTIMCMNSKPQSKKNNRSDDRTWRGTQSTDTSQPKLTAGKFYMYSDYSGHYL